MYTKLLEEKIGSDLKWEKVEDIPNFPAHTFEDVKRKITSNEFSFSIDFTTSNELAQWLYGKAHRNFYLLLASTPFIVAIISIILAIVLKNYWLLIGILLSWVSWLMANPYNPSKNFWKPIVGTLFLVFLYGLWQGKETLTYLSAFFVLPFFINNFVYTMNQNKLLKVALKSEKVFIYLYQIGKLGLKDNSNEQIYWYREEND